MSNKYLYNFDFFSDSELPFHFKQSCSHVKSNETREEIVGGPFGDCSQSPTTEQHIKEKLRHELSTIEEQINTISLSSQEFIFPNYRNDSNLDYCPPKKKICTRKSPCTLQNQCHIYPEVIVRTSSFSSRSSSDSEELHRDTDNIVEHYIPNYPRADDSAGPTKIFRPNFINDEYKIKYFYITDIETSTEESCTVEDIKPPKQKYYRKRNKIAPSDTMTLWQEIDKFKKHITKGPTEQRLHEKIAGDNYNTIVEDEYKKNYMAMLELDDDKLYHYRRKSLSKIWQLCNCLNSSRQDDFK